jgi:hypothetical protein
MKRVLLAAMMAVGICGIALVGYALSEKTGADAQVPLATATRTPAVPPGFRIIPPTPSVVPAHSLPPQPTPLPPTPEPPAVTGPLRVIPTESAPYRTGGGQP